MNISTSLICCDLCNVENDIDLLLDNGFNWLHADFMDGHLFQDTESLLNLSNQSVENMETRL